MSPILDTLSTSKWQLIATAVASGATVASIIFSYQALERQERLSELKSSIPSLKDKNHESRVVGRPSSSVYREILLTRDE